MPKKEFKFLDAYRTLVPTASREVIDARQKAHDKLFGLVKTMDKVYDLCRVAFGLPYDKLTIAEWFEKTVKATDVQFSLDMDKAEAARVAALVLRDLIWRGTVHYPLAIL